MSIQRSLPLLRLIATQSCRIRNAQPHLYLSERRARLPLSIVTLREFATTLQDQGAGRSRAVLVKVPKLEDLEEDVEIELLDDNEAQLEVTERAAEKLRAITISEGNPSLALRVGVESGGCHGYQYKMELTDDASPDDYKFSHPTHQCAIVIDAVSLGLLKGSTIDYATELIGSSFRVLDNPQAKGSGCGCGVSWEAKF